MKNVRSILVFMICSVACLSITTPANAQVITNTAALPTGVEAQYAEDYYAYLEASLEVGDSFPAQPAPGPEDAVPAAAGINGCSDPVPGNGHARNFFRSACNAHDACYDRNLGRGSSRLACDQRFHQRMKNLCNQGYKALSSDRRYCSRMADLYYHSVRIWGKKHYTGTGNRN